MNRSEKQAQVALIKNMLGKHEFAFVVGFKGLPSDVMFQIRYALKQHGSVKVVTNTLARIAAKETTHFESLVDAFKDESTLIVSNNAIESVKALIPFLEEHEKGINLKAGIFEKQLLNKADLIALGNTPSKEQSLAEIAYLLEYPMMRVHHMIEEVAKTK